jgi:very-short-patch-repair endonuclease
MKNKLTTHAKSLRKNMTDAEDLIWYQLRARRFQQFKFKRQVPMGSYIVDFVCHHKKLIVELDGGQHMEAVVYDERRSRFLESKGYKVIRFWNNQVFLETEAVMGEIMRELGCV